MKIRSKVIEEIKNNDPPIEVGQVWIAKNSANGAIMRRLRILAEYPNDVGLQHTNASVNEGLGKLWIFEEQAALINTYVGDIRVCPEFNLRTVFELENEIA